MYASDLVGTIHVLLAAAEVTPVEMHGYDAMTPRCISKVLEDLCVENAASEVTDLDLPNQLSPSAQELVMESVGICIHHEPSDDSARCLGGIVQRTGACPHGF